MFEGVVGRNGLGNIAIDDISIAPGVCPTAPQVQTGLMLLTTVLLCHKGFGCLELCLYGITELASVIEWRTLPCEAAWSH